MIRSGLDNLIRNRVDLKGRIGLLTHPAAVDRKGRHASVVLRELLGVRLAALFGPEHGYWGRSGAGEGVPDERHPAWNIPVYSLYGAHRRPTRDMLAGIDTLVIDLQDIGVRCYTFVSTLRLALEACAECGIRVVVCDRPIPLPRTVDGPLPKPGCESFVAGIPAPFIYGMTPGETALWLRDELGLKVEILVVRAMDWRRSGRVAPYVWVSPSPGIRYWQTAWTYPITVFTEALPTLDCGRGGTTPFQILCAPWLDAERFAARVNSLQLAGLFAAPIWAPTPGIRLCVTNPDALRPFQAMVSILCALRDDYGSEAVWSAPGTRPEWFDQLAGDPDVREALLAGTAAHDIVAIYSASLRAFARKRARYLLYKP
ncbi:MAG: DUF1343 domain-containing protein [Kiritimatiellae bacterium]|nr:DUF1343 domain-containing protein [Kiritimatiellia bacterium]MDW8458829.1 DUF1343 domain-containing protein [Verrucomicrobiota bacterium]